ncbi:bacteriorhodopsin [Halobaculum sp. WSA2]|uniref:Bacteriorhodopsin n=1 Tax=Halobaculum saliterrae TaxID=2073113 RepID=A0A6B0T2J2_9EURY|nr:bacteriorhodopsin [Halobaculum saliterrae]MXR42822.1 bacteriorhodopsin [Halobaculum saliterrae]
MIPASTLYLGAAGVAAVVFLGLVGWLTRIDPESRRVCGVVAGIVGFSSVAYLMLGLGIGTVSVAGGTVAAPYLIENVVAYTGFYVIAGGLAGASRRLIGAAAGVSVVQRIAFELPNAGYLDGAGALAAAGVVVGGWFVILWLFVGPIWDAAESVAPRRRLLHWKCRNLLLFLIGMLIVYAMCSLAGLLDPFVNTLINVYINLLIRVGIAGFLFVNAADIAVDDAEGGAAEVDPSRPAASGASSA